MKIALLIVFALGVVAYVIFGLLRKERTGVIRNEDANGKSNEPDCESGAACGVSCFCSEQNLRRQMSEDIVYYEDEELDAFKGIDADSYTPEQINVFSEVLTTLKQSEVPDWLHSLNLRGINLPEPLKEEALMLME